MLEDWTHPLPTEVSSMFSFGIYNIYHLIRIGLQPILCNEMKLKPQSNVLSILYILYLRWPSTFKTCKYESCLKCIPPIMFILSVECKWHPLQEIWLSQQMWILWVLAGDYVVTGVLFHSKCGLIQSLWTKFTFETFCWHPPVWQILERGENQQNSYILCSNTVWILKTDWSDSQGKQTPTHALKDGT